jgi:uncharacterized membrane protein (UPF0136 family)
MSAGPIVLCVYAVLMIAGGVMGYRAARSMASLVAGVGSGLVLLVALALHASSPVAGLWLGAITTLVLCFVFAMRLAKTGKLMPAGGLLSVSIVVLVLLTWSALRAQGRL